MKSNSAASRSVTGMVQQRMADQGAVAAAGISRISGKADPTAASGRVEAAAKQIWEWQMQQLWKKMAAAANKWQEVSAGGSSVRETAAIVWAEAAHSEKENGWLGAAAVSGNSRTSWLEVAGGSD